jgi:hypothetical protein
MEYFILFQSQLPGRIEITVDFMTGAPGFQIGHLHGKGEAAVDKDSAANLGGFIFSL